MTTITTIGGEINSALNVTIGEMAVAVDAAEVATTMISKIDDLVMMIGQDVQITIDMDVMIVKENEDGHLIRILTEARDHEMTMMIIMVVDVVAVVIVIVAWLQHSWRQY